MSAATAGLRLLTGLLAVRPLARPARIDARTDWPGLLLAANQALLGPALAAALRRPGPRARVPRDVALYLDRLLALNTARNERLAAQTAEAAGALNAAGIVPVALKGTIALVGPEPSPTRMLCDIDLLVPPRAEDRARAVLEALGYRCARINPDARHEIGGFGRPGDMAMIDLHDRPLSLPAQAAGRACETLSNRDLRRAARLRCWRGARVAVPSPAHRLLHLVLHDQLQDRDHFAGRLNLRHLLDIAHLLRSHPEVDVGELLGRLAPSGVAGAAESHLLAAHELYGAPLPPRAATVRARLHHARRLAIARWPRLRRGNDVAAGIAWELAGVRGPTGGAAAWRWRRMVHGLRRHGFSALRRVRDTGSQL